MVCVYYRLFCCCYLCVLHIVTINSFIVGDFMQIRYCFGFEIFASLSSVLSELCECVDVSCVVAIIGLISNVIMEVCSLEEDDSGIFITQEGGNYCENNMDLSGDEFVFPSSKLQDF